MPEQTTLDNQTIIIISSSVIVFMSLIYFMIAKLLKKPDFYYYTQDNLYGIVWKWSWKKEEIKNLLCHCPKCDTHLVYENDSILHRTYFLCPKCDYEVGAIGGGDNNYALGIVHREIKRKVRVNEFVKNLA